MRALALVLITLPLLGCPADAPECPDVSALVKHLQVTEGHVPERLPPHTPVVLLMVGENDLLGVHIDGVPHIVGGGLRLQRALLERRSQHPEYWVLQTEADSPVYRYWTPLNPGELRVNVKIDHPDQSHAGALVEVPESYLAMRIPFFPEGDIVLTDPAGEIQAHYRFGNVADAPLARVDER
ncbi:hypothetical protein ABI59_18625 [Acidobacteria bacterium Mor1]|nr:hypothetical protein ABI59_18625 [Acidobacteria bacterium Mor1]